MKAKQLANILLKILGIYFIVESLPTVFIAILNIGLLNLKSPDLGPLVTLVGYGASPILQLVLAFMLIFKSKSIAGFLFKAEEE